MLFHSLSFAVFFAVVFFGRSMLSGRLLRGWMVVASYVFYGWGQPWWCLLLLISTLVDYAAGLGIGRAQSQSRKRAWLGLSLFANLGLLASFKYSPMFLRWVVDFAETAIGPGAAAFSQAWLDSAVAIDLPVGISFYTFQTLSYTIDVYRGRMEPTRSLDTLALYVAFFPQLVAGPIERAPHLLGQLHDKQVASADDILRGGTRVLWGLVKKVVFADWLGGYVAVVWTDPGLATPLELWIGVSAFSFQLYLDFSAYSDIAIGLARIMGIKLRENFLWPFMSRNPVEFWQRWHISLGTWVRDYLWIPLGGNRLGALRTELNAIVVFVLIGAWHGASEKFILWGFLSWIYDAVYRAKCAVFGTRWRPGKPYEWRDVPAIFAMYFLVFPPIFFGAASLADAILIVERMFHFGYEGPWLSLPASFVGFISVLLTIAAVMHIVRGLRLDQRLTQRPVHPALIGLFWAGCIVLLAVLHAPKSAPYYYFQF